MSNAPSASDLEKKKAGAKHVETKAGTGPDPAALASMKKLYDDNKGDLGKIASSLKVTFKAGTKCKDGEDFAKRFLAGLLTQD
jgi:hypothetical protein